MGDPLWLTLGVRRAWGSYPRLLKGYRSKASSTCLPAPIQPGWIPWRGFIGPTFGRIGTIGLTGELRPKILLRQNPVRLRAGPYEASERDSSRLRVERKKKWGVGKAELTIDSIPPNLYIINDPGGILKYL